MIILLLKQKFQYVLCASDYYTYFSACVLALSFFSLFFFFAPDLNVVSFSSYKTEFGIMKKKCSTDLLCCFVLIVINDYRC